MRYHLTAILCVGAKVNRYDALSEPLGSGNAAARLHQAFGWRGGNLAARGARATAGHAGNRIPQQPIAQRVLREQSTRISPGPEGNWLYRGRERGDRIRVGRQSS